MHSITVLSAAFACVFLAVPVVTLAGSRSSALYQITTETTDAGGQRAAGGSYANDGSIGGFGGASVSTPAAIAKHGYISQLYEATTLQLAATPVTVNETGTRQLSAVQVLDDATTNAVAAASVSWSVLSGPITGINASGLATAGVVSQNTTTSVQGVFAGFTGSLNLTVLDTIADNFGSYGGDGLSDGWQVQHFGPNNPQADPLLDPDLDGLTNLEEFAFGLLPLSGGSLQLPAAQQAGNALVISFPTPAGVTGITYGAQWSAALSNNPADWTAIPNTGTPPQNTFSVPINGNPRLFMRLQVSSP